MLDLLAGRSLAAIRGADLARWRDSRLASGASANTVRLDLAVLSHSQPAVQRHAEVGILRYAA